MRRTYGDLDQELAEGNACRRQILFGVHRLRRPLAHLSFRVSRYPWAPAVFDDLPATRSSVTDSPKFVATLHETGNAAY